VPDRQVPGEKQTGGGQAQIVGRGLRLANGGAAPAIQSIPNPENRQGQEQAPEGRGQGAHFADPDKDGGEGDGRGAAKQGKNWMLDNSERRYWILD
jgi:hypothetical protein